MCALRPTSPWKNNFLSTAEREEHYLKVLAAFENDDVKMTSSGDIITMHQNQKTLLAPLGKLSDVTTALILSCAYKGQFCIYNLSHSYFLLN